MTGRGQRPGVAVRQNRRAVGDQLSAKLAQGAIRFDVFLKDRQRFINQTLLDVFDIAGFSLRFGKRAAHPLDRPK